MKVLYLSFFWFFYLSTFYHPNIVTFYGISVVDGDIGIVMEFLPFSLHKLLRECRYFDPLSVVLDVIVGLQYMHGMNIIHRDIKPPNILVSKKSN